MTKGESAAAASLHSLLGASGTTQASAGKGPAAVAGRGFPSWPGPRAAAGALCNRRRLARRHMGPAPQTQHAPHRQPESGRPAPPLPPLAPRAQTRPPRKGPTEPGSAAVVCSQHTSRKPWRFARLSITAAVCGVLTCSPRRCADPEQWGTARRGRLAALKEVGGLGWVL